MGIVNVTPDSFSDGGRFLDPGRAVEHGLELAAAGAAVLDVGGESTRPGSQPTPADEQRRRVVPVIRRLAAEAGVPVLVGPSRKGFVGVAGGVPGEPLPVDQRDDGTLAAVVWALDHGASMVRVHDVAPAVEAVRVMTAMAAATPTDPDPPVSWRPAPPAEVGAAS